MGVTRLKWAVGLLLALVALLAACSPSPPASNSAPPGSTPREVSADSTAGVFEIGATGSGVVHGVCFSPISLSPRGDARFHISVQMIQQGTNVIVDVPVFTDATTTVTAQGKRIVGGLPAAARLMTDALVTAYVVRQASGDLVVRRLDIGPRGNPPGF